MVLDIIMKDKEYQVIIERGILNKASSVLGFDKKVSKILIVTDDGIPVQYVDTLKNNIINTIIGYLIYFENLLFLLISIQTSNIKSTKNSINNSINSPYLYYNTKERSLSL